MKSPLFIILILCTISKAIAQDTIPNKIEAPALKLLRATENYSYLKDDSTNPYNKTALDALKYISLNSNKSFYLSLGGQLRTRYEHYENRFWFTDGDQRFYSQRLSFYSNLVLGNRIRIFGEMNHGYTSHEKEFAEY